MSRKKGKTIVGIVLNFKEKPKQPPIATETSKTSPNSPTSIKPLTEPQIAKYSMILCKLGSISDLSNFPTIQLLPIDRKYPKKPWKGRWANSKTNFHSIENRNRLQQEKLIFSCDWFFQNGALYQTKKSSIFSLKSVGVNPSTPKAKTL